MAEQILENIFRIPVPLPGNPLKEVNNYLIRGKDRNVLIDTAFNLEPCRKAITDGLAEVGVRREDTDVLLTHLHTDHSGLAHEFAGKERNIYISDVDKSWIHGDQYVQKWVETDDRFIAEGMVQAQLDILSDSNPALTMGPPKDTPNYASVANGDVLEVGGYHLTAVHVPGHTPGQMCFWLPEQETMFTGDHVLFDISPNICAWAGREDSLGDYFDSLKKIRDFRVTCALPGHRKPGDFVARIDDLLAHHTQRLEEARAVVQDSDGKTAYEITGAMTWRIRAATWETFPLVQKWFAMGECLAHLDYLRLRGEVRREMVDGCYRYYV